MRRSLQRGIPPLIVEWLLDSGVEVHDHQGGIVRYFDRDDRRLLESAVGREPVRRMNEWPFAYLVIDGFDVKLS